MDDSSGMYSADETFLLIGLEHNSIVLRNSLGHRTLVEAASVGVNLSTFPIPQLKHFGLFVVIRNGKLTTPTPEEALEAAGRFGSAAMDQAIGNDRNQRPGAVEWCATCLEIQCGWTSGTGVDREKGDLAAKDHKTQTGHSHIVCHRSLGSLIPKEYVGPGYSSIEGIELPAEFCGPKIGWQLEMNGRLYAVAYQFSSDGKFRIRQSDGNWSEDEFEWKYFGGNHLNLADTVLAILYTESDTMIALPQYEESFWILRRIAIDRPFTNVPD